MSMKPLIQHNIFYSSLFKIQDDFYQTLSNDLIGKTVRYSDQYIKRMTSQYIDPEYEYDIEHINPNTRMKIIEIFKNGRTIGAEIEYLNCDCYIDTELSLDYLVLVDDEE
ncbi:hypothetical protein N0S44_000449 [Escherichia coli]|nr:hypothetical protein [Escherichia coli]EJR1979294.1 hypothetical protein [Escherichia coli]UTS53770.1 hypothetical protein UES1_403 [Escherichia phage UE-S1]